MTTPKDRADAVVQYYAVMSDVAYLEDDLRLLIRVWRKTAHVNPDVTEAFDCCSEQLEKILDDSTIMQKVKTQQ